jgi:rubrerythrin
MTGNEKIIKILEICVELEMRAADLYGYFAESFPEDRTFWAQLRLEEKSHAALCRAALAAFNKRDERPAGMFPDSLEPLRQTGEKFVAIIHHCKANRLTRREACMMALKVEHDIGEQHYNQFMNKPAESNIETVFQQLNRGDKDHALRIEQLLQSLPD